MFDLGQALCEGKNEYLAKYSGQEGVSDVVNRFWELRHRVKAPQNDIDWWIKKPFADLKKFVDGFDTRSRSERRSDAHARRAEEFGAVLMATEGGYEIWYVPSYEAAVELGRFYKGVSVRWCICTEDEQYFMDNYKDSEFIFLVWSGSECPYEGMEKLALQVDRLDGGNDDYRLWDVQDNDIQYEYDYRSSPVKDIVEGRAMKLWDKIPYNRDGWASRCAEKYVNDDKWLEEHIFGKNNRFRRGSDGTVSAEYLVSDLEYVVGEEGVSFENVEKILDGDSFELFEGYYDEPSYHLRSKITDGFDEKMRQYGITWSDVEKIGTDRETRLPDRTVRIIADMLEDDFAEGNSYYACWNDARIAGSEAEARDDIMSQLKEIGIDSYYWSGHLHTLRCSYGRPSVESMVKEYMQYGPKDHVFQLAASEEGIVQELEIREPQYGWDGFADEMMKEYVDQFAAGLEGRLTIKRDSPGQMHFDFDKDFLDNPKNIKSVRRK